MIRFEQILLPQWFSNKLILLPLIKCSKLKFNRICSVTEARFEERFLVSGQFMFSVQQGEVQNYYSVSSPWCLQAPRA